MYKVVLNIIYRYKSIGENHIKYVLDGFNSTIFAYGQTSSGKTHTMEGPKILELNEHTMGLIPRIFRSLDEAQQANQENFEVTIEVCIFLIAIIIIDVNVRNIYGKN